MTIYQRISNIKHVLSDLSNGHIYQISGTQGWKARKKKINEKRKKISTYSPYYIGNTSHKNYVFVCNNTDHCKVDQGVHME